MKRFITIWAIGISTLTATANAQDAKTNKATLSFGAEAALPTGELLNISPAGLGGSIKAVFPVAGTIAITASACYQYYLKKKYFDQILGGFHGIPLKGGIRIGIDKGFYIEPQLGYTSFGSTQNGDGGSEGAFTYAGNIGYLINNAVDISARYESSRKEGSNLSHIGLRIAYSFNL